MTIVQRRDPTDRFAFTLIELLTVIAIISLLIGILVPSLSKARDQAKSTRTLAAIKGIGDALELFRNENEQEFGGYPPSRTRNTIDTADPRFAFRYDDPTEPGNQNISGAQLLVRYLMGKDFQGYVPRKNVPRALLDRNEQRPPGHEAEDFYRSEGTVTIGGSAITFPLQRSGPYLQPESQRVTKPRDLPGFDSPHGGSEGGIMVADITFDQPVILDTFGYPILYYAANASRSNDPSAKIARQEDNSPRGIYGFRDNVLWTGVCSGPPGMVTCSFAPWDFIGSGATASHWLGKFGPDDPPDRARIAQDPQTFPYYIMNKSAYDSTGDDTPSGLQRKTVIPHRRESFLLISAGKDGLWGTRDDVNNF